MSVDLERLEKNFAKDLSDLQATVNFAVDILKYGTFSQRRPDLGKMITCPFCHRRRREGAIVQCCNPRYATTQRMWTEENGFEQTRDIHIYKAGKPRQAVKVEERVVEAMFSQRAIKRLIRKRHGQSRNWFVAQLRKEWENGPQTRLPEKFEPVFTPAAEIEEGKIPPKREPIRIPMGALQAAAEMRVAPPRPEHVAQFAETYWKWKQEQRDRKTRKRVRQARKARRAA